MNILDDHRFPMLRQIARTRPVRGSGRILQQKRILKQLSPDQKRQSITVIARSLRNCLINQACPILRPWSFPDAVTRTPSPTRSAASTPETLLIFHSKFLGNSTLRKLKDRKVVRRGDCLRCPINKMFIHRIGFYLRDRWSRAVRYANTASAVI